jgi:hypothetical protein
VAGGQLFRGQVAGQGREGCCREDMYEYISHIGGQRYWTIYITDIQY